jgi:hypothetical protein
LVVSNVPGKHHERTRVLREILPGQPHYVTQLSVRSLSGVRKIQMKIGIVSGLTKGERGDGRSVELTGVLYKASVRGCMIENKPAPRRSLLKEE